MFHAHFCPLSSNFSCSMSSRSVLCHCLSWPYMLLYNVGHFQYCCKFEAFKYLVSYCIVAFVALFRRTLPFDHNCLFQYPCSLFLWMLDTAEFLRQHLPHIPIKKAQFVTGPCTRLPSLKPNASHRPYPLVSSSDVVLVRHATASIIL